MRNYKKIKAWMLADDVAVAIYAVTDDFPRSELYGLTSQLRRATASVPANIAEGASRASRKDYLHFLNIAHGSLVEVECFLHLAERLGFLYGQKAVAMGTEINSCFACLHGLVKAVEAEYSNR